jgi:3-oxoacyl-[acyl-carrier-protein] synthase-3
MSDRVCTIISGTGSHIPERRIPNDHFLDHEFYDADGSPIPRSSRDIIDKFEAITGIRERRYVEDGQTTSDIATSAAAAALESSGVDPESLDCIICAHNFGDVTRPGGPPDLVPTLASRIKHKLGINNPGVVSYDLPFGCPGWLEGFIHAHAFIQIGRIKRALVVGAETLSRVLDPHDRDSMIYADGAGACVIEGVEGDAHVGVLSHQTRTDAQRHAFLLEMGPSYREGYAQGSAFLKMQGHRVYEYAVRTVPGVILKCLEQAGVAASEIAKVFVHQANEKLDNAIVARVFKRLGQEAVPSGIVPMTIGWLGNSSVATLPTLLDLVFKRRLDGHEIASGDTIVFASVGAGMNVNAMVYRLP